jgi:hypothetical protein
MWPEQKFSCSPLAPSNVLCYTIISDENSTSSTTGVDLKRARGHRLSPLYFIKSRKSRLVERFVY